MVRDPNRCQHILKSGEPCGFRLGHKSRHLTLSAYTRNMQNRNQSNRKDAKWVRLIDSLKITAGCVDCGYNEYPEALDFDHLPGFTKESSVARLKSAVPEKLWAEIEKCEVVCANCHRHRTKIRANVIP